MATPKPFKLFYHELSSHCIWMKAEGEGARKKRRRSNASLWASCCSQYSVHQGGRRESLGVWFWGVRVFHFVMWCLFLISWPILHWRLVPFTPIHYFSLRGSWWIRISVSKLCVCPCAHLMLAWVYVRGAHKASVSLCVRKRRRRFHGCFRSLYLTVRQSEGARRGREREREIER